MSAKLARGVLGRVSKLSSQSGVRIGSQTTPLNVAGARSVTKSGRKQPRTIVIDTEEPQQHLSKEVPLAGEGIKEYRGNTVRMLVLDRPQQLNSLTLDMIRQLSPRIQGYERNRDVSCVIVASSSPKAFCAGGDVKALYYNGKSGKDTHSFFREEYILNHAIATMKTPYIPYMHGVTMGGGVGISVHARVRVASSQTLFAMPETAIGFFPDVGGSFFLPRLDGELGMYLALTGARLRGYDNVHAGIATHFVEPEFFPVFQERMMESLGHPATVNDTLEMAVDLSKPEGGFPSFTLDPHLSTIDRCFAQASVEQIIEALQKEGTEFAAKTVATLQKMSPTSLKVTHRQLRLGATKPIADCFAMEYILAQNFMKSKDFYEGVEAMLVRKDAKPHWSPASLSEVSEHMVESFFTPTADMEPLNLGVKKPAANGWLDS